jgi:hypothetical protein
MRTATAVLAGTAVIVGPAVMFWFIVDHDAPVMGVVVGIVLTIFIAAVGLLYFYFHRALWRGSVRAARLGLLIIGALAVGHVSLAMEGLKR